ncbi:uncharacterized protein N7459_009882 [Penicillium hispanicum]|uniref:uncharacterized protein n=1 Tax=Penicillium hispanicum TaxID=1080232 RepID=UPI00254049DE|nr:uncharacterized protein N7459_009882 [Penicillium hispanicum]KAJ5570452.1 hypothetical protein N7459_009882 [Penicillium hispanicum]
MEQKSLLGSLPNQRPKMASRTKHCQLLAIALFWLWVVFRIGSMLMPSEFQTTYLEYDGEKIKWESCGELKNTPLECSTLHVPMDQFDPKKSGDRTFTIPLIRMRGENATKNLLLNPGGPGGGGFDLIYRMGEHLKVLVGEGFHLVSFDPRGVNSSTPLASCYPDAPTRHDLSRVRSWDVLVDSPEIYAWTHNFVQACTETMGEYAKYINTPQTAADMNSILDALGQDDMFYWGFSYGSVLGQTYAGMFPERSERVIIDGVVDQFEWYGGLFEAYSQVDADKVLDGFLEECFKSGDSNCSLSLLATSKEDLHEKVLSYMEKLREQPISVYINNTLYGLLDYNQIWYNGVFPALLKPYTWSSLAENLHQLMQGNATAAFLAYGKGEVLSYQHEAYEVVTLNDGLSGPKHWPQDRKSFLNNDKIISSLNQSLFGPSQHKLLSIRQQWTVPKTHTYVPRKAVKTASPLLILSTTYDPVCPLGAARAAEAGFEGSQVVEVKGYGHCSPAVPSLCATKILRQFLYEGHLPQTYTQCEVDLPYFREPRKGNLVSSQKLFANAEDEEIHFAQLALAKEWKVPEISSTGMLW